MKARMASVGFIVALLSGCATKPDLTEVQYDQMAKMWIGLQKCVANGYISPEVGARGQSYIANALSGYNYNSQVLDAKGAQLYSSVAPNQGDCNTAAMGVERLRGAVEESNKRAEADNQAWQTYQQTRPKTTYCNQVGTQMICNSY